MGHFIFCALFVCLIMPFSGFSQTFTTNFDADENPISENGRWFHHDATLTVVRTAGGVAFGTQTGNGQYDDSNAYLTGFGNDYSIEGTVYLKAGISSSPNREVELLLRWSDTGPLHNSGCWGASSAVGYEINISHKGYYINLGRFKDCAALVSPSNVPVPANGDKFKAVIQGQTIIAYWNGAEIFRYTDNDAAKKITTGGPGIGFYIDQGAPNTDFGFTSVTVTPLGTKADHDPERISDSLFLSRNYPNPFNPGTTLRYVLPAQRFVILKISDMSGREITTLVNEKKNPGSYTVRFDGTSLPSGIYTAKMAAGDFVQTRKMLLVK
jgi:hypothetical protein